MKKTLVALTMGISCLIVSCSEDDAPSSSSDKHPKLVSYTDSFQFPGQPSRPQSKVEFFYNPDGTVDYYKFSGFNNENNSFEEQRRFEFTYEGSNVTKIAGFLVNATEPYVEHDYTYFPNGQVASIIQLNHDAGINTTATFTYPEEDSIHANYASSNGMSFQYSVKIKSSNNTASVRTTRGGQVCSEGTYGFDQNINPFQSLGYTDFLLVNVFEHNTLYENINYIGCGTLELIPMFYEYEYNEHGLPTSRVTIYKNNGSGSPKALRSFEYSE